LSENIIGLNLLSLKISDYSFLKDLGNQLKVNERSDIFKYGLNL